jgi:hypothetical protein
MISGSGTEAATHHSAGAEAANHHFAGAEAANHPSSSTTIFPCPMDGPMAPSSCRAAYVSLRYLSQPDGGMLVLPHVIRKTQIDTDLNSQDDMYTHLISINLIILILVIAYARYARKRRQKIIVR